MDMTLTTPALLFPAISLLLLAYTNRFVVLTKVIRDLSAMMGSEHKDLVRRQIMNLRLRLNLIRAMQFLGVLSFVACTISMFALFMSWSIWGERVFGFALVLLVSSLLISLWEVQISTQAINMEIENLDRSCE
ncbi:MAG: DUF2721 domain-containing protein [Agarilytica sp.]